jgi:hypothetical protein
MGHKGYNSCGSQVLFLSSACYSLSAVTSYFPAGLESWPVGPPRVPKLSPEHKPNFIVIQVDDMGWDDIGLHHPRGPDGVSSAGAQTPNIDKLIK